MNRVLHANASTTITIRKYIQNSSKSTRLLSNELNVSEVTIRKWRKRDFVEDKSHIANNLNTTLNRDEESLVLFIREFLNLTIDHLLLVVRCCVNKKISRSALGRFIKRKELKNNRILTYMKYSSSINVDCKLKNKNINKIMIIPFNNTIDYASGLLLMTDTKHKIIKIFLLHNNQQNEIFNALLSVCHHHVNSLLLVSEASAMRDEILEACNRLNSISDIDFGVYCESKMNMTFINRVGTIIHTNIMNTQHRKLMSIETLVGKIQIRINAQLQRFELN